MFFTATIPFEFVKLSDANLRHQAEYELRSKLIQLRRLYIPASVSVEKLCDLMSDSLASFAALVPRGFDPARQGSAGGKARLRARHGATVETQPEPFERIFEFRASGNFPATEKEANEIFGAYMDQVERVIEVVDEMDNRT